MAAQIASIDNVVLRGVFLPDDNERGGLRSRYAPAIDIEADGSHWYRTWLMLRDSLVYWPWYEHKLKALRRAPADFSAERMHAWTFDVMKQHHSYHQYINAAIERESARELVSLKQPVLVINDQAVPMSHCDKKVSELLPNARHVDAAENTAEAKFVATLLGHR
jgi:hypothetical protein